MQSRAEVEKRYQDALDSLVSKVQQDQHVLAAILFGSLSYDEVWEKSDIDLFLITADGAEATEGHHLVEHGVNIHAQVVDRNGFKRMIESSIEASFMPSAFARSTLLFSRDESIREWYEHADRHHIGMRDRETQLLMLGSQLLRPLKHAEEEWHVHRDLRQCSVAILDVVQGLANIEVILNGEVPGREVIQPALQYRPDFFRAIYTDLIDQPKDEPLIGNALQMIRDEVSEKLPQFFQPILDYLAAEEGIRSITEIDAAFQQQTRNGHLNHACEWLARNGYVQQVSTPLKLTLKSQVEVDEAAYHHEASPGTAQADRAPAAQSLKHRYREALTAFSERIQEDRYILAAFVLGDLARDELWEQSHIDVLLLSREGVKTKRQYSLVEDGVPVHATIYPRSQYKQMLERRLQGGLFHTAFLEGELLFTRDETIRDWQSSVQRMGARDRETQLLNTAGGIAPMLAKAEKWFYIKKDLHYSFLYIMYLMEPLARLEVMLHEEQPERRIIKQALKLNPKLFGTLYTDLIERKKDEQNIQDALDRINDHLAGKIPVLFRPLLDFLSGAGGIRTATELHDFFDKRTQGGWLDGACEWLAEKRVIEAVSSPVRITKDSRVEAEEAAYYYEHVDELWDDLM